MRERTKLYPYFNIKKNQSFDTRKNEVVHAYSPVDEVMLDREGRLAFTMFAMAECTVNELIGQVCTWQYAYLPSRLKKRVIFTMFLDPKALWPLNFDQKVYDKLKNLRDTTPKEDDFDILNSEIQVNLIDLYARFIDNKIYKLWKNNFRWRAKQAEIKKAKSKNFFAPAASAKRDLADGKRKHATDENAILAARDLDSHGHLAAEFQKFLLLPNWHPPRLGWKAEEKVQLSKLNIAGFDMTPLGFRKLVNGIGIL